MKKRARSSAAVQSTLDGAVAARGGPSDAAAQGTDTDIPSLELLVATGEVQIVEDRQGFIWGGTIFRLSSKINLGRVFDTFFS